MSNFFLQGPLSEQLFPNPYYDIATQTAPRDIRTALRYLEYVFGRSGPYRSAMSRVVAYFLTDIEIADVGDDEADAIRDYLLDDMAIVAKLHEAGMDVACYGNSFWSVLTPFHRFVKCRGSSCAAMYKLEHMFDNKKFFNYSFDGSQLRVRARCPVCKHEGVWDFEDKRNDQAALILHRWSPHEIEIVHEKVHDTSTYSLRISEAYKQKLRQGHMQYLKHCPEELMEAVRQNKLFEFADDQIYHLKESTLAGHEMHGWGLPRLLWQWDQVLYSQVLRRANEAIAMDSVIPFRTITPIARSGSGAGASSLTVDPAHGFNLGHFSAQVRRMIANRRWDPARWHVLPFPISYQALGGDASQLAPADLINQGLDIMLNTAGVPVELWKGTLQLQAAPTSLRLFEATWMPLVSQMNRFVAWVTRSAASLNGWGKAKASIKRVAYADDIQKQMMILQLMQQQQVSQTNALRILGLERKDERRRMVEEARTDMEQEAKIQEQMEQAGFAGQMAKLTASPAVGAAMAGGQGGAGGGGAPPAGGGGGAVDPATQQPMGPVSSFLGSLQPNQPVPPQEMWQRADGLANDLVVRPQSERYAELAKLRKYSEPLHAMVLKLMEKRRDDAGRQGRQQAGM